MASLAFFVVLFGPGGLPAGLPDLPFVNVVFIDAYLLTTGLRNQRIAEQIHVKRCCGAVHDGHPGGYGPGLQQVQPQFAQDVGGTARVERVGLGDGGLELKASAVLGKVVGDRHRVQARLRLAGNTRNGQLLAQTGPLSVGVDLRDGKRDMRLIGARQWFESQPPLLP